MDDEYLKSNKHQDASESDNEETSTPSEYLDLIGKFSNEKYEFGDFVHTMPHNVELSKGIMVGYEGYDGEFVSDGTDKNGERYITVWTLGARKQYRTIYAKYVMPYDRRPRNKPPKENRSKLITITCNVCGEPREIRAYLEGKAIRCIKCQKEYQKQRLKEYNRKKRLEDKERKKGRKENE